MVKHADEIFIFGLLFLYLFVVGVREYKTCLSHIKNATLFRGRLHAGKRRSCGGLSEIGPNICPENNNLKRGMI